MIDFVELTVPRGYREENQFCILKKSVNFTLTNNKDH